MVAQIFCFGSIIFCYTQYGVLQEKLIADKSKNLSAVMIMMIQYFIAVLIASGILIYSSPKNSNQNVFSQIFG